MEISQTSEAQKGGPEFENKFKVLEAQIVIKEQLATALANQTYQPESASEISRQLAEEIKGKLKETLPPQYKLIVQVLLGEQKGQGIAMSFKGLWDNESDNVARETFTNDSIFAVGIAYALYTY